MKQLEVVIVDDEHFNRQLLKLLVARNPNFVITGEAAGTREARTMILEKKPDVVFLDIKMPDGSGFDLLMEFEVIRFQVIFVTGFDEYSIKAFEFHAFEYVLKPIDTDKFEQILKKTLARVLQNRRTETYKQVATQLNTSSTEEIIQLPVQSGEDILLLNKNEVMSLISSNGEVKVYAENNKWYNSARQLEDYGYLTEFVPEFCRINQDAIINMKQISTFSEAEPPEVVLKNGLRLQVSSAEAIKKLAQR